MQSVELRNNLVVCIYLSHEMTADHHPLGSTCQDAYIVETSVLSATHCCITLLVQLRSVKYQWAKEAIVVD